jgi:hypothetical protein
MLDTITAAGVINIVTKLRYYDIEYRPECFLSYASWLARKILLVSACGGSEVSRVVD